MFNLPLPFITIGELDFSQKEIFLATETSPAFQIDGGRVREALFFLVVTTDCSGFFPLH